MKSAFIFSLLLFFFIPLLHGQGKWTKRSPLRDSSAEPIISDSALLGNFVILGVIDNRFVYLWDYNSTEDSLLKADSLRKAREEAWNKLHPDQPSMIYNLAIIKAIPGYSGGDEKFLSFINENIKYPKPALRHHIEGTVYVEFIIDENGKPGPVRLNKGIVPDDYGCNEEAVRIIKLLPSFKPGWVSGIKKSFRYYLPVKFNIQNYKQNLKK